MARRKKQDEDPSPEDINNSDETFGLPEIEYEPLQREESPRPDPPSEPAQQTETHTNMEREELHQREDSSTYYMDDDEGGSPWPKILGIAAILLVVAGGVWYFGMYRPKEAAALKAKQEQEAADAERQRQADLIEQKRLEDERRRADSLAAIATPAVGAIDTLSERTGRYYVIVASAIDGDLLVDFAKKLTPKGVNAKIILPYDTVKFYRLAVAEGDTYASTQATADQLKAEYTGGAWVIKY